MPEAPRGDYGGQDSVHNEFIYRRTAELLQLGQGTLVFDPESAIAREIEARVEAMRTRGINSTRISVAASKAQIDHSHDTYLPKRTVLEEMRDQTY